MLKIPTIEETAETGAYEARMHFLCPDNSYGRYVTQPGQVSEPTGEAVQKELPYENYPGLLMWVSFAKPEIVGTTESHKGLRHRIKSHPVIGKLAIATGLNEFQMLDEVEQGEPEANSFLKLWLGKFAMDRSRNFFGDHRHPLGELNGLHKRFRIREELDAINLQAREEGWDSRIDTKEWYVASLARLAQLDFPELFTTKQNSWHRRMEFPLEHRELPALKAEEKAA